MTDLADRPGISYSGPRNDILALIPFDRKNVLDLGCNEGSLGNSLKARHAVLATGVEVDSVAAKVAQARLDDVFCGDVESKEFTDRYRGKSFDAVICGDVLEHLPDPWLLLQFLINEATSHDAVFLISLPNVAQCSTLYNFWLRKTWPLNSRGIHDRTHFQWFTEQDARKMLESQGLVINHLEKKYRLIETIHPWNGGRLERLLRPLLGSLLVHQFVFRAVKSRG